MTLVQDIRYAARVLQRTPAFTLTATLSLAIGIGGTAAIFSLVDALFFRSAPGISEPERLIEVGASSRNQRFGNHSYPNYADLRDRNQVFEGLAAYRPVSQAFGLTVGDVASRVDGQSVSANYFQVVGAGMALGRGFRREEDDVAAPQPVTVLTYRLWQRYFNGRPDVIGQTIRLNGRAFTIVGVAAERFAGHNMATTDLWIPLAARLIAFGSGGADATAAAYSTRGGVWLMAIGRLKHDVTLAQARDDMSRVARDLAREYPDDDRDLGIALAEVRPIPAQVAPIAAAFIGLLFTLVALVLFIACANLAAVMLTRSLTRVREMGVRLALGASRSRIVSLLLTETITIGLAGSFAGVMVAYGLVNSIRAIVPTLPIPIAVDVRVDWRVVLFAVAVSLTVGVLAGLFPARHSARTELTASMKPDGGGHTPRRRLQHAFVVAQVAASVLLLVVALLLGRSLAHADRIDPGFDIQRLEAATFDLQLGGYDRVRGDQFLEQVRTRVLRLPGVDNAAVAHIVPLSTESFGCAALRLPGAPFDPSRALFPSCDAVSADYFSTMRIPLLRGRAFSELDRDGADPVAIVNETLARRLWANQDPIGQQFVYREGPRGTDRLMRVVGVARTAKYSTLGEAPEPFAYIPMAQRPQFVPQSVSLIVHVTSGSALAAVRALIRDMDPDLPVVRSGRLTDLAAFSLVPHRAATWVASAVGIVGLLLAAIGLYGVTAFNAQRRRREIGIRVAVGATSGHVVRVVTAHAIALAAIGGGIGLVLAVGAARLLATFLYDVGALDPWSFAGGMLLLTVTVSIASLIPTRAALRVDPVVALKTE
jgi:predicted permease